MPKSREVKFNEAIARAHNHYLNQEISQSLRQIQRASRWASSTDQWFELLRISNQLAQENQRWDLLWRYSQRALNDFPGREDFRACLVGGLLWDEKWDRASEEAEKLYSDQYLGLRAEANLVQESLRLNPMEEPYQGVLELLKEWKDPQYYQTIAELTGNIPLLADAALLWAAQGDMQRAYILVPRLVDQRVPDQLPGLIAYDWGDLETAQSFLTNQMLVDIGLYRERWTLNALLADISWQLGDLGTAETYYLRSLEIENNWKPLLNLSLLMHRQGVGKASLEWMEEGLAAFPNEAALVEHFVYYWRSEYPIVAQRLLNEHLSNNPEDISLRLHQILYFPREMSPQEYGAFLWELFNENCSNPLVTRFLLWYLMSQGNYMDAEIVMERYLRSIDVPTQWQDIYGSIIDVLQNDSVIPEIRQELESSPRDRRSWFYSYNLAVLQIQQGDAMAGLDSLMLAKEQLTEEWGVPTSMLEARVESLYALAYYKLGDKDRAMMHIQNSLELDNNNSYARRVLVELQS